jgi:hypothetical protein
MKNSIPSKCFDTFIVDSLISAAGRDFLLETTKVQENFVLS